MMNTKFYEFCKIYGKYIIMITYYLPLSGSQIYGADRYYIFPLRSNKWQPFWNKYNPLNLNNLHNENNERRWRAEFA